MRTGRPLHRDDPRGTPENAPSLPRSSRQLVVVPHGAHQVPFELPLQQPNVPKALTWGLVGPGKGLERSIAAVAQLRNRGIDMRYEIVGETHPNVRKTDGESYRNSLKTLAERLGVDDLIAFDDRYRTVNELIDTIAHADLVLLPYDSRHQITSGVLSDRKSVV